CCPITDFLAGNCSGAVPGLFFSGAWRVCSGAWRGAGTTPCDRAPGARFFFPRVLFCRVDTVTLVKTPSMALGLPQPRAHFGIAAHIAMRTPIPWRISKRDRYDK